MYSESAGEVVAALQFELAWADSVARQVTVPISQGRVGA